MNDASLRNLTGGVLILTPIAFNVFFTLLSATFEYPDILREPTGYVLEQFDAGGSGLIAIWYGFMLTAVLFVPLAVLVHKVLAREDTPYMAVATAFGVVAGVVQFLGLVRWPFLVPYLADVYVDPASSGATRESVVVVFEAFNRYAGVGVGENLGYLFTGLWTLLVALAMFGSALPLSRWLALLGMGSAAGITVGMLEPAGFGPAANVVVVGYILWSVWLALTGIFLSLPGSIGNRAPRGNPAGDPSTRIESLAGTIVTVSAEPGATPCLAPRVRWSSRRSRGQRCASLLDMMTDDDVLVTHTDRRIGGPARSPRGPDCTSPRRRTIPTFRRHGSTLRGRGRWSAHGNRSTCLVGKTSLPYAMNRSRFGALRRNAQRP
jgi:Domain of unknown function (DUF4386)